MRQVCWTSTKSKKRFYRYQGDKILIWQNTIKEYFPELSEKLMQPVSSKLNTKLIEKAIL